MAMGGSSAGANITLVSAQRIRDLGLPVPGALYVATPSVDLNLNNGDSRFINEGIDRVVPTWRGHGEEAVSLYAGELGLDHPFVSSINGDFSNLPPTYLISGTRDLLLSDTVRAHRALRRVDVKADLHINEGFSHGDYMVVMNAPESFEHYAELNRFVLEHLSVPLPSESMIPADLNKIEIPKSAGY